MPFSTDPNHRSKYNRHTHNPNDPNSPHTDQEEREAEDKLPIWEWISDGIFPKVIQVVIFFAIGYTFAQLLGSAL